MSGFSVSTIKSPEFINITSVSPMISKCEIKVLYVGQNRNHSFISKEVATQMAQTLPGTPIVGYYSEKKEDFGDHGEQVVIDGDGIRFNCLTKPYGFVDLNTKVWFKEFEDTDEFGNKTNREYLMCEGYLWTEQYEEAKQVLNSGKGQSMELDGKTLKGHWSTDTNSGIDFFIITDSTFSKLCILGDDTEPCFEGASVTAPDVSSSFSLNSKEFTSTLFNMMKELKELTFSLKEQGGNSMDLENGVQGVEIQDPVVENNSSNENENFSNEQDNFEQETSTENQTNVEEFKKNEEEPSEEEKEKEKKKDESSEEEKKDEEDDKDKDKVTKNALIEQNSALEAELNELREKYSLLEAQNAELMKFKETEENKKKDALIAEFYMLSDEDKKDVIDNKSKYSLDEIESKLSVICRRKKVNFQNNDSTKDVVTTFNLNSLEENEVSSLPAWLKAVEDHGHSNN